MPERVGPQASKAVPGPEAGPWRDEPLGLIEPIVSERLSKRQQKQIRRDTFVSQEKGGGVDETACWMDMPSDTTVALRGEHFCSGQINRA